MDSDPVSRIWSADNRLAAAAFIVAAAFCSNIFSMPAGPRWWAIAILLPLASDLDPRRIPLTISAGIAWSACTLLWAPRAQEAAFDLYTVILLALAMSAGAQLRDPGRVVIGFALGLVPSAAIAWGQAFYDWSIVPHAGAAGLFLNREVLAETAAPIAVWGVIRRGWIGMAVCALASIPLAICQSRVSVGAAAVALVLMAPIRRRAKVSILALVVLAGSIALITMGIGKFGSGMQRIVLWGAAILTLDPRGQGLGWWASVHMQPNEEYVHSDVLQIFVELGLPGVLLLIAPAAALRGPSTPERAALATIAIESVVSFPLHTPAVAFLAAVLAGGILRAWADVRLAELVGRARNVLGALRWKGALAAGVVRSRARELSEVSMGAHFWAHHFRGSAHGSGELRE